MPTRSGDAVIAATCIYHDLILITRNEKDFKEIPGLEIYNLFAVMHD
jgi:predicted nucleic acid-binding protein